MSDTVADVLLARLRDWGVKQVFGYPGDGINGLLAAWGRAGNEPQFVQARHEEMAAFEAVGFAKFSGQVGVCVATSGPGAIHLLNGLYDAKLDHVPVVAIVGPDGTLRDGRLVPAGGRSAVACSRTCAPTTCRCASVPEQLPNLIDRAIRIAMTEHAPTCVIIPSDVFDLEYDPPGHAFKQVPSSLGLVQATAAPDPAAVRQVADLLNAGEKVALLVGQGARGCVEELTEVADLLGAGAAKALLGKDVLPDTLPWVTGSIGLLGTRASYDMMMGCDTLLTVGSNFPYTQFMPPLDQARAVQIDRSGKWIGMRYPYEINLVGDAKTTLPALIPLLNRKTDRGWREKIEADVADWWDTVERRAMTDADPVNPMRIFHELSTRLPANAMVAVGFRQRRQLVRPAPQVPRRHPRLAVRHPGHHGPRRALRDRREMGPPGPAGDRPGRRRGDADERHGRVDHHRALLVAMGRPTTDRGDPAQQRPEPGHLGDAGHGGRPEVRRIPDPARRRLRRRSPAASACTG